MRLKDALKKYSGKIVKLGSASSYVYCGKVGDDICEILDEMSVKELERLKTLYAKVVKHNERFERIWMTKLENTITNFRIKAEKEGWGEKKREIEYMKVMGRYDRAKANDRRLTNENLRSLPPRIEAFTNYPEREVKEEYDSIEGGTIVIFEGLEQGDYWTVEEYEKANKEDPDE